MVSILFGGRLNKYTGKKLKLRENPDYHKKKEITLDEFCDENAGAEACAERVNEE